MSEIGVDAVLNESPRGQGEEALENVACGAISGIVGKYIEYPFDTVKVRLQSQPEHFPLQYAGPLDCFKQSLRREGFLGLYRGISAPLVGAAVETSSLFFSYQVTQDILRATVYPPSEVPAPQDLPFSALLLSGAASGAATSLLLTPIELVKCKMQVPLETSATSIRNLGPLNIIASIYRHQGVLGFWNGQLGTLIRETGGSAAWFGSNEGMKALFRRTGNSSATSKDGALPIYQQMTAGAAAGMSYNFIFYPADTIKSRMQTEDVSRLAGGRRTFGTVGKALWKQQGLKGLYRGCGITVARSAPSSAFIFTIFEELKRRWSE
ncbi:mitochondrial carrier [Lepidopterella palustris CBS 459.81]|uniref:Mitochondrial carrier n=1 Tax=Lepidopterella palustris CBS 459.81 TaxID=1314670 RepID=A0A8E2EGZ4_9PEZI|nr:mitochondrial carrier [Lepidopterella palustris CBS 459.81]